MPRCLAFDYKNCGASLVSRAQGVLEKVRPVVDHAFDVLGWAGYFATTAASLGLGVCGAVGADWDIARFVVMGMAVPSSIAGCGMGVAMRKVEERHAVRSAVAEDRSLQRVKYSAYRY